MDANNIIIIIIFFFFFILLLLLLLLLLNHLFCSNVISGWLALKLPSRNCRGLGRGYGREAISDWLRVCVMDFDLLRVCN